MSITDELRAWAKEHLSRSSILAIADRIDEEHERVCNEQYACGAEHGIGASIEASMIQDHGYIELPKDVDGEYIHIGDEMEYGNAHGRVIALMLSNYPKKWGGGLHWGIQLEGEHAPTALDGLFHHYKPPTVEDVLEEFVARWLETHHDDLPSLKAEYAAKLRLAGDAE